MAFSIYLLKQIINNSLNILKMQKISDFFQKFQNKKLSSENSDATKHVCEPSSQTNSKSSSKTNSKSSSIVSFI